MIAQPILHGLIRLFPESYRSTRGEELHDALSITAPRGRAALREAMHLCLAACTAWRRFLLTPTGIRHSFFFGLMAWFGVLIAVGPVGRLQAFNQGVVSYVDGTEAQFVAAAALMSASFLLLFWRRSFAAAVGGVGLVFAALSIRVAQWGSMSALLFEARWLGLALVVALLVRGKRSIGFAALVSAVPGVAITLGVFEDQNPAWFLYSMKLSRMFDPYGGAPVCSTFSGGQVRAACTDVLVSVFGGDTLTALVMLVGVVMLVGAWYLPALAVVMMPGAFHFALATQTRDTATVAAYLLVVVAVRLLLRFDMGKGVAAGGSRFGFRLTWRTSSTKPFDVKDTHSSTRK